MRLNCLAGLAVLISASPAAAQEVTLRAVSAFAEGTEFSRNFERFIEKVNADGKGSIRINYIGGPRAVPPFESATRCAPASSTSRTRPAPSIPISCRRTPSVCASCAAR